MKKNIVITLILFTLVYLVSSCDINTHGLIEDDPGKQRLEIFSNGLFKYVCIGKTEAATIGVSNVMNFKCNDGRVVHNITNYIIK